ncbi:MAG: L-serine ammonia-lyase [Sphaerochaetaceae bacterium]|nr:L-serine ammonia-lyase [Sphaerochaetaceae bacterium]MDC7238416.1 L-serine ammonia-lyase [Sphaerochaetaceae bacterium]MDC7242957.1 L-serine ammonia-lyase [Sphaerochaetaceae bacterium]
MESIRELYKIGYGPSSSHTMGPRFATNMFLKECPDAFRYEVVLFGSLAATGKGHLTNVAIEEVFEQINKPLEIIWKAEVVKPYHPNALTFYAYNKADELFFEKTYYSVGGGSVEEEGEVKTEKKNLYGTQFSSMQDILTYCENEGLQLWEFVKQIEDDSILDYIEEVWRAMTLAIKKGLDAEGVLPGGLKLQRKASMYYSKSLNYTGSMKHNSELIAYALAVSEENASGNVIVTAPTCGSCGILPGVLYYLSQNNKFKKSKILNALLTAGLIGNIVKENASISGAEVGCQGEVGVACAMASAAATQIMGGSIYQIEYAAEMGLEHHLGLTCDPMLGLVQIPCIERNAMGAVRAIDHCTYVLLGDGRHKVSFDEVVSVMKETGQAIPPLYRETSLGGLALIQKWKEDRINKK